MTSLDVGAVAACILSAILAVGVARRRGFAAQWWFLSLTIAGPLVAALLPRANGRSLEPAERTRRLGRAALLGKVLSAAGLLSYGLAAVVFVLAYQHKARLIAEVERDQAELARIIDERKAVEARQVAAAKQQRASAKASDAQRRAALDRVRAASTPTERAEALEELRELMGPRSSGERPGAQNQDVKPCDCPPGDPLCSCF